MDTKQLNQALYDKMEAEQNEYWAWLMEQLPAEILLHAVEYAVREDILMEMEASPFPPPLAEALLESPSPLADVYKDFRDMETDHMDHVQECIKSRAERLMEARQEAVFPPIYQQSIEYAREHGELETFIASRQANIACKEAIEAAILAGYDGISLAADPKAVLAEFGPERVTHVLAATIQRKNWDERFSRGNKAWAEAVPIFEREDLRSPYIVHIHSGVVNLFVNMVRKELDAIQQQAAKKPSIKEQLTAKPAPGGQPPKPKGWGER